MQSQSQTSLGSTSVDAVSNELTGGHVCKGKACGIILDV